jgi:hypothetical protein
MTTSQYLEFEGVIGVVEEERGGLTMTAGSGNLSKVCAAQQRARNTRLSGEVSAVTNLAPATAHGKDGGGNEATAVIVPTARGVVVVGGDTRGRD